MKERPILFSGSMVRAILAGRKTVTRRVIKPGFPTSVTEVLPYVNAPGAWIPSNPHNSEEPWDEQVRICPYGQPGDRLWVRETYADIGCRLTYRADQDDGAHCQVKKWTPAIHMFRKDSRILLEITALRVERLQAISRSDIRAEGLQCPPELGSDDISPNYRDWYPAAWRELWESINGADSWNANPWVWVVEFKRVTP